MKLVDVTDMHGATSESLEDAPGIASFDRKKGLTSFGQLQVDSDALSLGEDFVRMLIMTSLCLNEHISKTGTNSLGWGSSGFEDPVPPIV